MKPGSPLEPSNPGAGASLERPEPRRCAAPDEHELVARARARDAEAYRELVERYQARAYGLALRIVRSAPDAEEVAQDGFVRAWAALPGFRGESGFGTWLHRIVARLAIDRAALLRRRRGRESGLDDAASIAETRAAPDAGLGSGRIERLLECLSPSQRAVVALYYLADRSVQDVATALGLPTGTVKTHLSRARAVLRAAWLAEEGGR